MPVLFSHLFLKQENMMIRVVVFVVSLLAFCSSSAFAQAVWKSDLSHSRVNFAVSHMVVAEVTGSFTEFEVTMRASNDDFSDAEIEATIKTASVNTDNERRDGHLRSDDFFNAEAFPAITFKSTSIEKSGKNSFNITGDLTIRDITMPVVLATSFKGTIRDARGNTKAGFKATTVVNRFEFGTKWNSALDSGGLIAGENVDVTLLMEMNKQEPAEENSEGKK